MSRKKVAAGGRPASSLGNRSKDDNNMLEALKFYENKNYKRSLKILDTVLKKNPGHVESLALKGLNYLFIEQRSEAATYIEKAVSKIVGTAAPPICCHLLGIYYRQVKDYVEAIKWFQASLDNGSTNKQIYRDLSSLQSQVGDWKGLLGSRQQYWENFMGYRANWTSLATAHDLNGQYTEGAQLLSRFEELAKGKLSEAEAYEHSECLMYKNDLLYKAAADDSAKLREVLAHLDEIENEVFDKYAWYERRAAVYMRLGCTKEASQVYRILIKRNPDNFKYYRFLEVALGIQGNGKIKKALYEKLERFYPRAEPPKFIPLTFINHPEELEKKLEAYILGQLCRGVPAAFNNIKPLYVKRNAVVPSISEKIVTRYFQSIDGTASPIQYVWTAYYLAQHFLFLKNFVRAQECIDLAINHTPTLVELYILKARILKHVGLLKEAAEVIDEGRKLDLQDRFVNTKTVKYFLRANMIDKAVEVVSLFTKNDNTANGVKDLHLMEASWFIVEQAEAYYRLSIEAAKKLEALKELPPSEDEESQETRFAEIREQEYQMKKFKGLSLKRFSAIPKIYKQFEDDKLDFHSYCMRKGTPRAYMEMLRWGDQIFVKPMYVRALVGVADIYFSLDDELRATADSGDALVDANKRSNRKARKVAAALNKRKGTERNQVLAYSGDEDPFGDALLATKSPVQDFYDEFYKWYASQVRSNDMCYDLDFRYHLKCGKTAPALGALTKMVKYHSAESAMTGAMVLSLANVIRDSSPYDLIAKKVAAKGLETEFPSMPLDKVSDPTFNWLEYLTSNFSVNVDSLVFLYRMNLGILPPTEIKNVLLEHLSEVDPYLQNQILQYVL
ncbi:ADR310Wp [Eremothecium gossypii ATCC 10895]|uniref:ADR310Wp n=1 Tax=Eremothecium gossypii (strain ATCC 10895 / CBS 109.51 / FGSC 9923 / NRRL Y-1056) TaxID=284811 RepID=Q759G6_EREGS|nr:ADR310Wp [Eremothecium gossypii ATCC 10895]AAS52230.2 ADR310Wp [Eremothecium gossypii ATCC 10895]